MKLIHLSDLHLGKRLNEFSLIEDQRYILNQILDKISQLTIDGVIIAGDVYDKNTPSTEAVTLLDDFLYSLSQKNLPIYLIGGNHDSQERLSFGGRIFSNSNIYISNAYSGSLQKISLKDSYGDYYIYLLPFIKPSYVKRYFKEEEISSYTDAIRVALKNSDIDYTKRNVLVTHQFVTGATTCESEELSVGGSDNVDAEVFSGIDYVALGHIHGPQNVKDNIRYCGTPLKYSFSEVKHKKSITLVEIKEKGNLTITEIPLNPLHDLVELKGTYADLTLQQNVTEKLKNSYVHITLTDEETILNGLNKLRVLYPNLMKLDYDNARTRQNGALQIDDSIKNKSPLEIFEDFYKMQNGTEISSEQKEIITDLITKIWEENA
ncbi:MAG: exonuclease SbcCD subunit D [Clostridia bacterium]|nr:exonuclease SbcCD subunit D [Clostridia bacterium]